MGLLSFSTLGHVSKMLKTTIFDLAMKLNVVYSLWMMSTKRSRYPSEALRYLELNCHVLVLHVVTELTHFVSFLTQLRRQLDEKEVLYAHETEGCTWHPEFGGWMIESTPSRPYSKYASDLLRVERNMILRRRRLLSLLKPNEIAPYVRC